MRWLRRFDLRVLAAPVVQRHHASVIRAPLIRTHAEQQVQLALQRHEEPAGGAGMASGRLGRQRLGATRPLVPALGGLGAPQGTHHMPTGQVELLHGIIHVGLRGRRSLRIAPLPGLGIGRRRHILGRSPFIARRHSCRIVGAILRLRLFADGPGAAESLLQPRIIRIGADRIGHRQIGRFQTVLPRHPFRRTQRLIGGHQRRLVHRPAVELLIVEERHRPLPSLIPTVFGGEPEVGHAIAHVDGFHERADLIRVIGHRSGHATGDRLWVQHHIGHVRSQSSTSKLSATARSNVASFLLSAADG